MIKPTFGYILPALALVGLLSCAKSPFDPSTNQGADIINSLDPSIADFGTAYRVIDTTIKIDSVWSHRDLVSKPTLLEFGSLNGERSFGYFRFDTLFQFSNQSVDSVDQVMLYFTLDSRTVLHTKDTARVQILTCAFRDTSDHSLLDTSSIQRSGNSYLVQFDSLHTTDSVLIDPTAFRQAFNRRNTVGPDTVDTANIKLPRVGYCLTTLDSGVVVRMLTPSMQVRFLYASGDTSLPSSQNTSPLLIESSVYETNPAALDLQSRSSFSSGRYTEMKLNMAALWDSARATTTGKRFTRINGCNLVIPFDTTWITAEQNQSTLYAYYRLAPFRASPDSADTSLAGSQFIQMSSSDIEAHHSFILNLQSDANTIYGGGKAPPSECLLTLRVWRAQSSSDLTWRWVDWKLNKSESLKVLAAATNPR